MTALQFTQLLLNLVNLRGLFGVGTNLKSNLLKNNKQISSTITTRTSVSSTEWARTWPSIGTRMRNGGSSRLYESQMFLFRVRYHINKDKGDKSQPLLAFLRHIINITFQKYSKEGRSDFPRVIQELEISRHMFATMTQNITRSNLNTGVFRNPSNV